MNDLPLPVRLRKSTRAKRLRLIVKSDRIECVLPPDCPEHLAWRFLDHHRDWLVRHGTAMRSRAETPNFWSTAELGCHLALPFQGRETPLWIRETAHCKSSLRFDGEAFVLSIPEQMDRSPHPAPLAAADALAFVRGHAPDRTGGTSAARAPDFTAGRPSGPHPVGHAAGANGKRPMGDSLQSVAERSVFRWAKSWLHARALQSAERHGARAGLVPRRIRIKRMKTRWGSCGAQHDINLNWLLTFTPPAVLDYVVVHELCHIRHRDHSANFWRLVGEHLPGYGAERDWLKQHGGALIGRFGLPT